MKKIFTLVLLICAVIFSSSYSYAETPVDFTLKTLDGQEVTLSALKGKKVLINFFATWCPACRVELKEINKIIKEHPEETYSILCISVDDSPAVAKSFIEKHKYEMTVLFDDQNVASKYKVTGIPALFLINADGEMEWSQAGAISEKELKKLLGL